MGTPPFFMKKVYEAASEGDWNSMKTAYNGPHDKYMMAPITVLKDTAFHLAVYSRKDEPLKSLLKIVDEKSIPWSPCTLKNAYGNTVLHEAVFTGNMKAVKLLLQFKPTEKRESDTSKQLETKNALGETPLYRAASCGKKEIVEYLATQMGQISEDHRKREDSKPILHAAIQGQHFETALTLLELDRSLDMTDEQGRTGLHLLAGMPRAFKSGCAMPKYSIKNLIYCCLSASNGDVDQSKSKKGWKIGKIQKKKNKHESALKLARWLIEKNKHHWWQSINVVGSNIVNIETPGQGGSRQQSDGQKGGRNPGEGVGKEGQGGDPGDGGGHPLFIATSNGIEEIAKEILQKFPQYVELINETGQNIMHVAVMHRQWAIYRFVEKKFKPIMVKLSWKIDNNGYTLLHHIAHMKHYRGGTKPSPVLKLQEEIQWFKVS
ncbi:PREDICTED: uncharacterized protein LOC105107850 [Populus euphratica]|uniref:Uncharacterized protein LOC105107850 n=1 Tax=Populus euphratica TaxID=75702 RepID=A0AAJ6SXJ9_POPEU|nr:PREDICTED: uncharacterized protein LOC105107850 [Populus euphratica]